MSAINVNSITGRTGTHGPVLTGVTTATNGLNVTGGLVGIGTDNPTAKLDVVGDAKVTGVVTATSFSGSGANLTSIPNGDIGTAPENIPINQYLGKQAFVDEVGTLRPYFPTGSFYSAPQTGGDIQFRYVSDTSIQIVMKGLDGTIRSTTLTLS